jgi:hypothetical protein
MREIVVVPTLDREPLLHLCLEAIRKQEPNIPLRIFLDKLHHENYGNTSNAIAALQEGTNKADSVHYIEDDTIVHPGYFEWARKALAEPNVAAVCGRIPSEHFENWYSAPCASWNADKLCIALSHVTPKYLAAKTQEEMRVIVDEQMFPKSRFYRCYSPEQDGFLLRCIEHYGWQTRFPPKPLATHLGYGGYNRPAEPWPTGSFEEQVQWFRDLLVDRPRREKIFGKHVTDLEWEALFGGKT